MSKKKKKKKPNPTLLSLGKEKKKEKLGTYMCVHWSSLCKKKKKNHLFQEAIFIGRAYVEYFKIFLIEFSFCFNFILGFMLLKGRYIFNLYSSQDKCQEEKQGENIWLLDETGNCRRLWTRSLLSVLFFLPEDAISPLYSAIPGPDLLKTLPL